MKLTAAIISSSLKGCLPVTSRITRRGVIFLLVLALIFCTPVFGGDGGVKEASESKAALSPVGGIESLGAIRIDRRPAQSGAVLWGNELLEAPAVESAQLTLNYAGVITLSGGSALRLVSVPKEGDGAPT